MEKRLIKNLLVSIGSILVLLGGLSGGLTAHAASLTVSPVVIDKKAQARDILKESLTLTNAAGRKLNVYTFVNNVAAKEGEQEFLDPSRADYALSLANWIEIPRGAIELLPGEKSEIDFVIRVNLTAEPGMYHAIISFADGSTRYEAEKKLHGAPAVTVNLEVAEDIRERLRLEKFVPDKIFFSGFPVSFSYKLVNTGNRPVVPSGEVRIYNRKGEEVASIEANGEGLSLAPDGALRLSGVWPGPKSAGGTLLAGIGQAREFGRYKAYLVLEYGLQKRGAIQDTIFFWVIPWMKILMVFGALSTLIIFLTLRWHRHKYAKKYGP